jgi:cytochrome P450
VHQVRIPEGDPAWVVPRYDDVRQLLADPRLSLSWRKGRRGGYTGWPLTRALARMLLNVDPPDHTRLRRLVSRAFTPRRVETLRMNIQARADQLLDEMSPNGGADLIESYAAPLPVSVICDLLGVPVGDSADFRSWANALVTPSDAGLTTSTHAQHAVASLEGYIATLIAAKRDDPGDDLLSDLIAVRDHDDALTEHELMSMAFLVLLAGYETTVHLIGNSVLALLQHPDQLTALRNDPHLLRSGVEELLRYAGPGAVAIRRFAAEDIELGDVTISTGDLVLLLVGSANRDPGCVPDPDRLDLTRADVPHLALGHGIHYCLGAGLARLEAELAIGTLVRRFPQLALAAPATELVWRSSFRIRGLKALPVNY